MELNQASSVGRPSATIAPPASATTRRALAIVSGRGAARDLRTLKAEKSSALTLIRIDGRGDSAMRVFAEHARRLRGATDITNATNSAQN